MFVEQSAVGLRAARADDEHLWRLIPDSVSAFCFLLSDSFFELGSSSRQKPQAGLKKMSSSGSPRYCASELALAGEIRQLKGRRFTADRQPRRRCIVAELEFVQSSLQFIEPKQETAVLAEQLPAQPAKCQEDGPSHYER